MRKRGSIGFTEKTAATKRLANRTSILLALLFFCGPAVAQQSVWYARCVGVSDGDTIKVLTAAK
jgi:hypothetical protein